MNSTWKVLGIVVTLSSMIGMTGCASAPVAELRTHFVEFDAKQKGEYLAALPGEYRIQEGDRLAVVFSYLEEQNRGSIIVLPDGSVTLPGIDRVVLAGHTISEADDIITSEYGKTFRNPDLSVIIENTVGRQVYVVGEVVRPGLYPVPHGGIGILSAIGAAGGFTDDAKRSNTVLVRMTPEGYYCQEIDLSRFYTVEGVSYTGVGLESYDVIYVPRSRTGDFAYFSTKLLGSIGSITRIISDVRYIESGARWR